MSLYNLPDIEKAHRLLIYLNHYIEDTETGEPLDSHFENLEEAFSMALNKDTEKEAIAALDKLKEFIELAAECLERQAKEHLSIHNKAVRYFNTPKDIRKDLY